MSQCANELYLLTFPCLFQNVPMGIMGLIVEINVTVTQQDPVTRRPAFARETALLVMGESSVKLVCISCELTLYRWVSARKR